MSRRGGSNTRIACTKCPATADLADDPRAWNGWQIVPRDQCTCPACIKKEMDSRVNIKETRFAGKVMRTLEVFS